LELELTVGECASSQVEELAAEDAAQHADRQEEARLAGDPSIAVE
jgi:hypothetical protein